MKEVYEVFRKGTFVAVVKQDSRASKTLESNADLGLFQRGDDVVLERPEGKIAGERLGLVEQVK